MSIIKASCVDQTLRLTNTPIIASGGVNEDFVEFSFCPLWDGYIKTAVFYNNRGVFYSILDKDDSCVVPYQALELPGNLFIAVFGYKDGVTRTSEVLQYQIVEGAITAVSEPDPDVYEQIMEEIAEIRAEWNSIATDLYAPAIHAEQHKTGGRDPLTPGDIGAAPEIKTLNITLSAENWVDGGNDIFTQAVTVEGGTDRTLVSLQPTDEQMLAILDDGVSFLKVDNDAGTFTAKAGNAAPSTDMTVQATIAEVRQ